MGLSTIEKDFTPGEKESGITGGEVQSIGARHVALFLRGMDGKWTLHSRVDVFLRGRSGSVGEVEKFDTARAKPISREAILRAFLTATVRKLDF